MSSATTNVVPGHEYCHHWSERCLYNDKKENEKDRKFLPASYTLYDEPAKNNTSDEEEIDVVSVPADNTPSITSKYWYCSEHRAQTQMEDCREIIDQQWKRKSRDPLWYNKLQRDSWNEQQYRIFDRTMEILHQDLLVRLSTKNNPREIVLRRSSIDDCGEDLRYLFAEVKWDTTLLHWLHALLTNYLPIDMLTIYSEIIQTLRSFTPKLVEELVKDWKDQSSAEHALQQVMTRRPWGPALTAVAHHNPNGVKLSHPAVFLFVPCINTYQSYPALSRRFRFWTSLINHVGNAKVVNVYKEPSDPESLPIQGMEGKNLKTPMHIGDIVQSTLRLIAWKIREVRSRFSDRKVILIGWNSTSIINCYASLLEPVDAIICCGFPTSSMAGLRGSCDDELCEVKTPTYFVSGTRAIASHPADIEQMRRRCFTEAQTGALVVHGANDYLRVPAHIRKHRNCTQSVVDRYIFDHVIEFIANIFDDGKKSRLKSMSSLKSGLLGKRSLLTSTNSLDGDRRSKSRDLKQRNRSRISSERGGTVAIPPRGNGPKDMLARNKDATNQDGQCNKMTFNMNTGVLVREGGSVVKRKAGRLPGKNKMRKKNSEDGGGDSDKDFRKDNKKVIRKVDAEETEAAIAMILSKEDDASGVTPASVVANNNIQQAYDPRQQALSPVPSARTATPPPLQRFHHPIHSQHPMESGAAERLSHSQSSSKLLQHQMNDVTASASYRAGAWLSRREDEETMEATAMLERLSEVGNELPQPTSPQPNSPVTDQLPRPRGLMTRGGGKIRTARGGSKQRSHSIGGEKIKKSRAPSSGGGRGGGLMVRGGLRTRGGGSSTGRSSLPGAANRSADPRGDEIITPSPHVTRYVMSNEGLKRYPTPPPPKAPPQQPTTTTSSTEDANAAAALIATQQPKPPAPPQQQQYKTIGSKMQQQQQQQQQVVRPALKFSTCQSFADTVFGTSPVTTQARNSSSSSFKRPHSQKGITIQFSKSQKFGVACPKKGSGERDPNIGKLVKTTRTTKTMTTSTSSPSTTSKTTANLVKKPTEGSTFKSPVIKQSTLVKKPSIFIPKTTQESEALKPTNTVVGRTEVSLKNLTAAEHVKERPTTSIVAQRPMVASASMTQMPTVSSATPIQKPSVFASPAPAALNPTVSTTPVTPAPQKQVVSETPELESLNLLVHRAQLAVTQIPIISPIPTTQKSMVATTPQAPVVTQKPAAPTRPTAVVVQKPATAAAATTPDSMDLNPMYAMAQVAAAQKPMQAPAAPKPSTFTHQVATTVVQKAAPMPVITQRKPVVSASKVECGKIPSPVVVQRPAVTFIPSAIVTKPATVVQSSTIVVQRPASSPVQKPASTPLQKLASSPLQKLASSPVQKPASSSAQKPASSLASKPAGNTVSLKNTAAEHVKERPTTSIVAQRPMVASASMRQMPTVSSATPIQKPSSFATSAGTPAPKPAQQVVSADQSTTTEAAVAGVKTTESSVDKSSS